MQPESVAMRSNHGHTVRLQVTHSPCVCSWELLRFLAWHDIGRLVHTAPMIESASRAAAACPRPDGYKGGPISATQPLDISHSNLSAPSLSSPLTLTHFPTSCPLASLTVAMNRLPMALTRSIVLHVSAAVCDKVHRSASSR